MELTNITLRYITLRYVVLYYIILHYITLHYITLHYITLRGTHSSSPTLHYITSRFITLHYITRYAFELTNSALYLAARAAFGTPAVFVAFAAVNVLCALHAATWLARDEAARRVGAERSSAGGGAAGR